MTVSPLEIQKCNVGGSYLEIWIWKTWTCGAKMRFRETEALETIVKWAVAA